jgi:hypothetical protein
MTNIDDILSNRIISGKKFYLLDSYPSKLTTQRFAIKYRQHSKRLARVIPDSNRETYNLWVCPNEER